MIKKPDLRIDTEFFDDNLNGLHIPEAIRVTQSIDTQTFIKEGLSDELEDSTILAIQTIEKIISQRLFDHFLICWSKLKANTIPQFSSESTPYSQKGHRRQSPLVQNISDEYETASNTDFRGMSRQKVRFNNLRTHLEDDSVRFLEQQRRNIRSKTALRRLSHGKTASAEKHYERAKVLKEIVDKLKFGRQLANSINDQVQSHRQNQHLYQKINKLQKMMEDVHFSAIQRGTAISEKLSVSNSRHANKRQSQDTQSQLVFRLKQELSDVKSEMEKIRRTNQQILREEQWKKAEIMRIASSRSQIQYQYQTLRNQITFLERERYESSFNNLKFLQSNFRNQPIQQQYEYQMYKHAQKLGDSLPNNTIRVNTSIIPHQSNPFGYSTFTTSQKNSNAIINEWEQATKPLSSVPPSFQINEQAREKADQWACC